MKLRGSHPNGKIEGSGRVAWPGEEGLRDKAGICGGDPETPSPLSSVSRGVGARRRAVVRPTVAGHGGQVWVTRAMGLGHPEVMGHAVWASPRHPGKWGRMDTLQTGWGAAGVYGSTSLAGKMASG